jgi:hypothetical protein
MTIYAIIVLLNIIATVYGLAIGDYSMVAFNGIVAAGMVGVIVYSERKN